MSKTCETCKWYVTEYGAKDGACYYVPPPWKEPCNNQAVDILPTFCCSKWETKKERECRNCEFFAVSGGGTECRREPPDFDGDFPATDYNQWCGEFKGRE